MALVRYQEKNLITGNENLCIEKLHARIRETSHTDMKEDILSELRPLERKCTFRIN